MDSQAFDLHNIFSLRCSINGPLFCQQCESCKLNEKVNLTKAWFIPISDYNKKLYLQRLIYSSFDLLPKLPEM